ncbi:Arginyl tRNA synthetase [Paragonimus heterotremus]|uniref:Probable arginine--tRNA ligase, mitochondrial n=1 Tax=Paragonimus heterotremus TaxID=100268 RepID=A0A8J4X3K6_9TREM|nr:Arginyl tRNA synthetase [Paragonimus heterotremus]
MDVKTCLCKLLIEHSAQKILNRAGQRALVVVDYSSPNVAKPFHLGHFRATVTGNFIRNLNEAAGHRVISVNYLGDWGTQFDLLTEGWKIYGNEEELVTDPVRHLNKIYVQMNTERGKRPLSVTSAGVVPSASTAPVLNPSDFSLWKRFRQLTMEHLKKTYARMNVQFTTFEYESDYVQPAHLVVQRLLDSNIAVRDKDGVTCIPANSFGDGSQRIVLLKSNNSTLYLTRDLAAAISRYERYHFDRIHYVVEDGQRLHFNQLRSILQRMGYSWAAPEFPPDSNPDECRPPSDLHIPFGRVQGVSTRQGEGLFLSDILDNAQQTVLGRMARSPTTRTSASSSSSDTSVADHLAVTCLAVEMLRKTRQKPIWLHSFLGYPLVAESTPLADYTDLSGLGLQYCHARLCSLERRAVDRQCISPQPDNDVSVKQSSVLNLVHRLDALSLLPPGTGSHPAFMELLQHLNHFPDALRTSYANYEASTIVQYATRLTSHVNSAWKQLPVLNCEQDAEKLLRLGLFIASRNTLATCLRLLGVHPLCSI